MKSASLVRPERRKLRATCWVFILGGLLALVPLQRSIEAESGASRIAADVLYVPSGNILRRMCLGHEGLLANIYWTRVVQYFGRKRLDRATRFEMLGPLLRITTELDPQLVIAYRFGAIFLGEKPPWGPGEPEEALHLLRRGIVANPDYWRLWQDLGFVYYWDLKDYEGAARAFRAGSERPGAMVWMKVLAARVVAEGGALQSSRVLWSEIYRHADNEQIRQSARDHLAALQAQEDLAALDRGLALYRQRAGRSAATFRELVQSGLLKKMPRDPFGAPYVVGMDGRAALSPQTRIDLGLLQ